jgi:hypothetical protein
MVERKYHVSFAIMDLGAVLRFWKGRKHGHGRRTAGCLAYNCSKIGVGRQGKVRIRIVDVKQRKGAKSIRDKARTYILHCDTPTT